MSRPFLHAADMGNTVSPRLIRDDALLLVVAAIWGLAFVAQRVGMEHVGPFTFNGVRFALGSLSLVPLVLIRRARADSARSARRLPALPAGLGLGAVLFVAATLQQVGMVTTGAGKAGFITGLYVVLVPLVGLAWGQRAGWNRWAGAMVAVAGLYLLSVTGTFIVERGDLLVLAGAFFWAAHVQLVGVLARRQDPIVLASLQFAACALLSMVTALITESPRPDQILRAAAPILYGGLGSVGVAYTLQIVVQRTAHPAHAAILLSLEGVFAATGGWIILGESLGTRSLAGCIVMLCGMLLSQLPSRLPDSGPKGR